MNNINVTLSDMNGKIIACTTFGFIVGIAIGILIGVFVLPSPIGTSKLIEYGYKIIPVSAGERRGHDFGNYHYIFYNSYPVIITNEYGPAILELEGNYVTIPMGESLNTVFGLHVIASEFNQYYTVCLAKLP